MKNKLAFFVFLILVFGAVFFILVMPKIRTNTSSIAPRIFSKCPDDFANDDAGEAEYLAAINKWTNNFYDSHPGASLGDWGRARHQFWVENNCTAALQRYQEAKSGKADPATMEQIHNGIQDAINDFNRKN
ncbi:hypothetical protein KGQ34_02585 [Patescibacteria group bacterium]|nr:hypothetical protein [Patescibacteria group bacterium]